MNMKNIIEFAGNLRFAFWLLIAAGAVMWIGSIYAASNHTLIYSLNGVPLIEWFTTKGVENISVTWWIPVMFVIFTLLGINIIACTINRVLLLLPRKKIVGTKRFLVLIAPSVIHFLFMLMLAGHLLSFTAVSQKKIPVAEGETLQICGLKDVMVKSIKYEYFPDSSMLRHRIKQTTVEISAENNGGSFTREIAFMEPAIINGNIILLDMEKKRQDRIVIPEPSEDSCNREQRFHYAKKTPDVKPQLYLLVIKDPGLVILLPGFFIVILIMGWYFYQINNSKKNKEFMEVEHEAVNG
ncbi:MAG TPA: hypothetical protein PK358_00700 [Spirochaetota bacterium]|nr:hypothetical protein [Spirochaetota bacterium]HPJ33321.1 hypothetical protein [Spirochaetota bacterium]